MTSVASPPPASSPGPEGLRLFPFRALRFATSDPAALLSPPYDVIDEDERRELEASDPHNVVRLILPRDLDGQPRSAYQAAASLLSSWRSSGVLVPDPVPAVYVYEMEDGSAPRPLSVPTSCPMRWVRRSSVSCCSTRLLRPAPRRP